MLPANSFFGLGPRLERSPCSAHAANTWLNPSHCVLVRLLLQISAPRISPLSTYVFKHFSSFTITHYSHLIVLSVGSPNHIWHPRDCSFEAACCAFWKSVRSLVGRLVAHRLECATVPWVCGVCMFSPCSCGFPLDAPVSSCSPGIWPGWPVHVFLSVFRFFVMTCSHHDLKCSIWIT